MTIDIIDGSRGRYDAEGWQELERTATVEGLSSSGQQQLVDAIEADGMPAIDDAHPSVSALRLAEMAPEALGPGKAKVRLVYKRLAGSEVLIPGGGGDVKPTIEVGTTLQQVEANKDIAGNLISVTYNGTKKPPGDLATQIGTYSRLQPQTSITIKRREWASPLSKSRTYVGTTNSQSWEGDPSAEANTWLCTAIIGTSSDGGAHYEVSYAFQHCGATETGTWDVNVYWRGSDGKIPSDIEPGTGIVLVSVYGQLDFDNLNF